MNVIDLLEKRGFIDATTHDKELRQHIDNDAPVTCYIGFDPTASSLHVGSLVPIMALAHMQKAGHRPIALVGGGTGLVGDPSGKTEMRPLLTMEEIETNAAGIKAQLARFIDFSDNKALLVNNADWLVELKYIPFLRDIGRHFSVNRMIKAESYRIRLESDEGLNFIEFNYMLLQAYDFLKLYEMYGCRIQMGGSDQWGNIVAGIDLIRRVKNGSAFGITFPLVTTSSGAKMGKTAAGAVWLDPDRTSPYDYFQYWMNTDDRDVKRFLLLFTFLPESELDCIDNFKDADYNMAKTVLAFEATMLAHGKEEAEKALNAARAVFSIRDIPADLFPSSSIHKAGSTEGKSVPEFLIGKDEVGSGIPAYQLFCKCGLVRSMSEARRLIKQGGAYIEGIRVTEIDHLVTPEELSGQGLMLRAGKKKYQRVRLGE